MLDEVAARVSERLGDGAIVEPAHMELAHPTIAEGFARCVERGATTVIAHPFMLSPGRHAREDLPRMVAEAASAHPSVRFVMAGPLGAHEGIIDAIVDRCETAAASEATG